MNQAIEYPPRLSIDSEAILKLFTGETFYSNVDASLREAVLNSIDAIGRRSDVEPFVKPEIRVEFNRQSMTITVTDNGDGMGPEETVKLFSKVGASTSKLYGSLNSGGYSAIGEFGIGVLSYFLVCEEFQVHSKTANSDPIGLNFTRSMLDAQTLATRVPPLRKEVGTQLILQVTKENYFTHILHRYSHWFRNVEGLHGLELRDGKEISQGGLSREIKPVTVDTPEWIHEAHIGPPVLFESWDTFDGSAHVDVLYRGVFVERVVIPPFWGITGSIHVDPKYFRPQLNREGFVGNRLPTELEPFLRGCHPAVLEKAIECVRDVLGKSDARDWSLQRWVTLWLAVPRSGPYQAAAEAWDHEFRNRKAFRLLRYGGAQSEVSISDLTSLISDKLYIAPDKLNKADQIVQQAVRILRDSDKPVIQGVTRDTSYLGNANLVGTSTSDLLVAHFRDVLPVLTDVATVAHDVINQEAAVSVFEQSPQVKLVNLGTDTMPVIPVGKSIWINIDSGAGKKIVRDICGHNRGHVGFWIACLEHGALQTSYNYATQIASILSTMPKSPIMLGPIRRQFLRRLVR